MLVYTNVAFIKRRPSYRVTTRVRFHSSEILLGPAHASGYIIST